jgi:tetratricopeptide (TPR) repeat protein
MAVANGNFAEAEKFFTEAAKADARNAEAYNMLAYSQRKQGKLDPAFANYRKALYLHPRFPEAREYLGEAHIQAVLQEIKTLKSYGAEGDEQLRELVAALKAAAEEL